MEKREDCKFFGKMDAEDNLICRRCPDFRNYHDDKTGAGLCKIFNFITGTDCYCKIDKFLQNMEF